MLLSIPSVFTYKHKGYVHVMGYAHACIVSKLQMNSQTAGHMMPEL